MGCCSSSPRVEPITHQQVNQTTNAKRIHQQVNLKPKEKQKNENNAPNLATEIKNWKNLIDTLQQNASLNRYALARKRNDFRTLDDLFAYISAYKCQNQYEQAWLIYVWITDNIEYNMVGLLSGNLGRNDPESVLRTGLSVCEGFASLFERLCQVVGIECCKITGYSKAFGYSIGDKLTQTDHAWNTIKIGGKWFYVEATWGAGYADSVTNKNVKHITIRGCYIKKTEIKCDCLYKLFSTQMSSLTIYN
jgi:kyphoscoliosis peptidase